MAFIRKEPQRPLGFVDPSTRYTDKQLEEFWTRLNNGDDSLDETIDLWLQKRSDVTIFEILQSEKYKERLWKIEQPVKPCGITFFDTYLENFYEWFNIGRVAWRLLAVLADLDRKIFRENHLAGLAGEVDRTKQLIDKYISTTYNKNEDDWLEEEDEPLADLSENLNEYANFLNDIVSGHIVPKIYLGSDTDDRSIKDVERDMRENVVRGLQDLVYDSGYDISFDIGEDLYKDFVSDAEGLIEDIAEDGEEPVYVPKVFKD